MGKLCRELCASELSVAERALCISVSHWATTAKDKRPMVIGGATFLHAIGPDV